MNPRDGYLLNSYSLSLYSFSSYSYYLNFSLSGSGGLSLSLIFFEFMPDLLFNKFVYALGGLTTSWQCLIISG